MSNIEDQLSIIEGVKRARKELIGQKSDLDKKINDIDNTIIHLWEMFDICPACVGHGKRFHRACAEDEGQEKTCDVCNGRGTFKKGQDEKMKKWL